MPVSNCVCAPLILLSSSRDLDYAGCCLQFALRKWIYIWTHHSLSVKPCVWLHVFKLWSNKAWTNASELRLQYLYLQYHERACLKSDILKLRGISLLPSGWACSVTLLLCPKCERTAELTVSKACSSLDRYSKYPNQYSRQIHACLLASACTLRISNTDLAIVLDVMREMTCHKFWEKSKIFDPEDQIWVPAAFW